MPASDAPSLARAFYQRFLDSVDRLSGSPVLGRAGKPTITFPLGKGRLLYSFARGSCDDLRPPPARPTCQS